MSPENPGVTGVGIRVRYPVSKDYETSHERLGFGKSNKGNESWMSGVRQQPEQVREMNRDTFREKWDWEIKRQGIQDKKACTMKRMLERWSLCRKDNARESTREAFEGWIASFARLQNVRDWQVVEAVRACELAHRIILDQKWAREMDWEYWKYRFKELESTHVTIAGEFGRMELENHLGSDRLECGKTIESKGFSSGRFYGCQGFDGQ